MAVSSAVADENSMNWRISKNRVDADINDWNLEQLLKQISRNTGWQIYVDPDASRIVSTRFSNLTIGDALGRLLGDLNYAVLPQTNGLTRLYVFRNAIHEATQLVSPPTDAIQKRNNREILVAMKPGKKDQIDALAASVNGKVTGKLDKLGVYRLTFDDAESAKQAKKLLETNPDVSETELNNSYTRPTQIQQSPFSSASSLTLKASEPSDPNQFIVGLIDTSVQSSGSGLKDFLLPQLSVADKTTQTTATDPTHGTSMAEVILRSLSNTDQPKTGSSVRILPIDVYGNSEETTTFDIALGITKAAENGAKVINLSLGGDGDSQVLHQIIKQGHDQGIIFIAAAGNSPTTTDVFPAAYPEVIAATAGDKNGNLASYAGRGNFVDVMAPGSSIVYYGNEAFIVTGTSTATAYVSGIAAGLATQTGKTQAEVEALIRKGSGTARAAKP